MSEAGAEPESPPPEARAPATAARPTSARTPAARFAEWVLRRDALRAARSAAPLSADALALATRARDTARVADRLLDEKQSTGPGADAAPTASGESPNDLDASPGAAISLYREAACWALCALGGTARSMDLAAAFAACDASVLRDAAGGTDRKLAAARAALVERTFVQTADLDAHERATDAACARAFVAGLILRLDGRGAYVRELHRQRWVRVGGLAVVLVAAAWLALTGIRWLRPDLAATAAWRTSSASQGYAQSGRGFHRPEGGPNLFFHTNQEESPWIEFDLGAVRDVHGTYVSNRMDCCQERALPLIVEVSVDGRGWTEVARRTEPFYTWTEWFRTRSARYVRFRVPHATTLHLGSVEIR